MARPRRGVGIGQHRFDGAEDGSVSTTIVQPLPPLAITPSPQPKTANLWEHLADQEKLNDWMEAQQEPKEGDPE